MGVCSSNKNKHNKHNTEPNKLTTQNNTEIDKVNHNDNKKDKKKIRKNSMHTRELNRISNKTILDGKINIKIINQNY
jgi:hypothetical protein